MMVPLLLLSTGLSLATAQYFEPRMIVCRDFNMDKLSGAWCSISLASNNLTRIQKNGDLRVFIRTIENLKNNSLKFNFYFSLQGQCEPIAMVCEKTDQNGLCTITYEGKNTVRILETIYSIYVTFYLHKVRDGVEMRVLALYGRVPQLSSELQDRFQKLCQKHGLGPDSILRLRHLDTC